MILKLALAGALGSLVRVLFSNWSPYLPFATIFSNFLGVFLAIYVQNSSLSRDYKMILIAGLCGGLTTMSGFVIDLKNLFNTSPQLGLLYLVATIIFILIAIFLALKL